MTDRKTEPPLHLPMSFGEALSRSIETKPHEVQAPPGRKPKAPRPKAGDKPGGD